MIYEITEAAFKDEVLYSEVPVLVDFYSPSCGPCRQLEPHLKSISRKRNILRVFKVNVTQSPGLVDAFSIRSVPTLVLFKDGVQVATHIGGMTKKELEMFVEEVLSSAGDTPENQTSI